ncbi:hypothetical protein E2562_019249 [Oryza meyeriana var. granulata]|uniref:RST domain-containing protein n=1 Tax=Oryza meyeriana var. granulata TaxID=110450 RepID=A0A6G1FAB1_9ORYZ|nr:hypothetical protein E2562_019249 [Oryza meyeriana var. granulata]
MASPPPEARADAGASSSGTLPQNSSDVSKSIVGQLQAAEQEGNAQANQQTVQHHMNLAGQLSQPKLVTEGLENEMLTQLGQHNHQPEQESPHSENNQKQAETNSFQLAEKETGYAGLQNFAGPKVDVAQTSGDQQHVKQMVGQQAPPGAQDTRKRGYQPSIPFNMLIPILQAHLDRDKDMQLQTVWAKLRRNEVHKDDFLRVIRNIVGDQMLKQAAHKVFAQMQAQAQRSGQANVNQQANANQYSLPSQVSSSGSTQLHDQEVDMSTIPNQGQKTQALSSSQAFVPSGTQVQSSMTAHDNSIQRPDAKGMHAMANRPPVMNSAISAQTMNKQQQPTQVQQVSQQIYGTTNRPDQPYTRPISGSTPLRSLSSESEIRPSLHPHGMVPGKTRATPTHQMTQHNAAVQQMQQNKDLKSNASNPRSNAKQDLGSAGKARPGGTGGSSTKSQGKQGPPNVSTPPAARTNKKSAGQKKSLETAGSTPPPPSKKQKTAGTFQEQSIDQLNDVTAVSGVNLREEEEQLLSAPKEESWASEEARRIAQEEDAKLFLQKGPLLKKLAEIIPKCNLKNISNDVEHCLSMCVEERLRRFISTLIRVSKQRIDMEKTGHRLVITSDVGRQILRMNQKAKEEWDKKQAEETDKNKKQNEVEGSGTAELDKEKEETRPKNAKPNKEEDDKMRTTAANVAARQAVGGSDMLSKWQLMAEQARQKREGLDPSSASQRGTASRPLHMSGKGPTEHHEASKRTHSAAFGTGSMSRQGRGPFSAPQPKGPQRTISVKDVICVLEREPQMTKSRLIYRLYERLPGDTSN